MADFLDEKRSEIRARLKELKPLVDEYQRLEAAAAALDGVQPDAKAPAATGSSVSRRARAQSAPKRAKSNGSGSGRRGRPKGTGTRGAEALALVRSKPGITIPEIAEQMGIKQNYLYRVLPGLADDGLVKKDGRGWHPQEAA